MIKRNSYMNRIRPFIDKDLIKVLTGIRRSGKSMMLEIIKDELIEMGIKKDNIISYNFESFSNTHLLDVSSLYNDILHKAGKIRGKVYLFFDEIQEVKEWEKVINSLRVDLECDIYITGSNAKLLSGELATYLSGRYVEFIVYPFSLKEFTELYSINNKNIDPREIFNKYLELGGMPYLYHLDYSLEPSQMYLKDLYNALVLKDVVKRNSIRDVDLMERILAYIMANVGTTFSASNISKYFKNEGRSVSTETVLNYINACEQAFLFHRVKREDLQGKKILTINEKYYMTDMGIREAVYGNNIRDINLSLENLVYMELLRRGYEVTIGKYGDKEIDFIGKKNNTKIYVQVAYILATPDTIEREFSVLEEIADNYPKYVVTMDEFNMSRNGIEHINIRSFLLEE